MRHAEQALLFNSELDVAGRRAVQRRVVAGELYRVRPGIASALPPEQWPSQFKRENIRVLAALFPKAVISCRSAFDGMAVDRIYLVAGYRRVVELPGYVVDISEGRGPIEGDRQMGGRDIYFASTERMLIEGMASSRSSTASAAYPRGLKAAEIQDRLMSICDARGEDEFGKMRDRVKAVGRELGAPESRLAVLDSAFGAILGTRPNRMATSQGTGRARGYDAARMDLFHKLVQALKTTELPRLPDVAEQEPALTHFAFLESYFSNFIEGTEFEIDEARAIALGGKISSLRPKDSHDIKGVFAQAYDKPWRAGAIDDIKALEAVLRARHRNMLAARPEALPGEFKTVANRAGNTPFVLPNLVRGTLQEAGLLLHDVERGLPRALLAMFIVTEVHPFVDGNGRLARLVMNSELSAAGQSRIIVPTLYREQYLDCLRALTREGRVGPYIAAMANIQRWSAAFEYSDMDKLIDTMTKCHAFERSLVQFRLLSPDDLPSEPESDRSYPGESGG